VTRPVVVPARPLGFRTDMESAWDGDGFDALVRRNQPRLFRIIRSLVWDPDAAATLTQECFLRAYRGRADFRGAATLDTWLVSIALNIARDHLKSRRQSFWRRLVRGSDTAIDGEAAWPDPAPSPERTLAGREALARVFAVVEELSPQQREAFVLRFVEEMSLDEIAGALGVTEGTVKAHLHRATTAVRRRVKEAR
jgi:RNA polymerase sigma-70 factor, ECF subfamily